MIVSKFNSILEKSWITEAGYPAEVVIQPMGHRCGYVHLPKDHPSFGQDYDSLDVEVHGGLTHGAVRGEEVVFGFDCAHSCDLPAKSLMSDEYRAVYNRWYSSQGTVRSLEFCVKECESLAMQFKAMK